MLHPGQQQERGHGPVSDMSWFQWSNLKTYQKICLVNKERYDESPKFTAKLILNCINPYLCYRQANIKFLQEFLVPRQTTKAE